jgi:hypothetical protein
MSMKERQRLVVLGQVSSGGLTVAAAGGLLGLSERQIRRVWRRYQTQGDAGLVHRLRGRAGNRRMASAGRWRAVALYREHYRDFGPTLACEYLAERHALVVDDQTLRRWLIDAGLWQRRRKHKLKRHRRLRKPCFGELVQLDGSPHDWFEGRLRKLPDGVTASAPACCLMVMVDDATGWTEARFFDAETTMAAMTILRVWATNHGLPQALYPDRHSIHRRNDKQADQIAARTGKRPPTQFGRALLELGVKLIWAGSPQAKGRVERMNGTLQDRLVKALRIEGISELPAANRYLDEVFLPRFNAKFAVAAADATDLHTTPPQGALDEALCVRETRTAGQDQCVNWEGQVLQLRPQSKSGLPSLAGKQVTVRRSLDGQIRVLWREQVIAYTLLAQRPRPDKPQPSLTQRIASHQPPRKPSATHPWRSPAVTARPRVGDRSATARAAPSPPLRDPQPAA